MSIRRLSVRAVLCLVVIGVALSSNRVRTIAAEADQGEDDPVFSSAGIRTGGGRFAPSPFESVDTITGNLLLSFTDLVLPGNAGFNLTFVRTYNSRDGIWRFGVSGLPLEVLRLEPILNNSTYLMPEFRTPDGGKHATLWESGEGTGTNLITQEFWRYDFQSHVLKLPNGIVCSYESGSIGGRLSEAHDSYGNSLTFDWSVPGTLTVVQDLGSGQARTINIAYSGTPGLSVVTSVTLDVANRTWSYQYSADGLTGATPPAGPGWSYGYSGPSGRVTSITTPNGGSIGYSYDLRTFDRFGGGTTTYYTVIGRSTGGSLPTGSWDFAWTQNNSTTTITGPVSTRQYSPVWVGSSPLAGTRSIIAAGTLETETLTYQEVGLGNLPVIATRTLQRGPKAYSITNSYSGQNFGDYGNPNHIQEDGDLHRTTDIEYSHDDAPYILSRPGTVTVSAGGGTFTTVYAYEPDNGFLLNENRYGVLTQFGNDGSGNRNAINDANNNTTFFTYEWGVLKNTVTPEYTISRSVNLDGTIASETRNGHTTSFGYDNLGRLTSVTPADGAQTVTSYTGDGSSVTVTRGSTSVTTSLDGFGRATGSVNAVGVQTSTQYDAEGRMTLQSYPFTGGAVGDALQYDALNRLTRITHADASYVQHNYDGTNVTIVDENNHPTLQRWEAFGDPSDARLTSLLDAKGQEWGYSYNSLGSLTQVGPPAGPARTWSYNGQNRLDGETQPESGTTTYGYDAVGNLNVKDDAAGRHFTYGYDLNNRLKEIVGPGINIVIGYDDADNRTSFTSNGANTTLGYDAAERMTSRTEVIDQKTFHTTFEYDTVDNLKRINYPSGRAVCYGFDNANRIAFVNGCNNPTYAANVAYHPSGAVSGYDAGNGTWEIITFDGRARPKSLKSFNAGGALMDLFYSYDDVGNVNGVDENVNGHGSGFGYDELDRLSSVTGYGAMSFDYDSLGNRLHKYLPTSTVTYNYAGNLRLSNSTDPTGDEQGSYSYDNVGNTLSDPKGASYGYNALNMMTSATTPVAGQTTYAYDADNVRTIKSNGAGTEYYVHGAGGQLLAEYRATATDPELVREYIYLGGRLLASFARATPSPPALSVTLTSPTPSQTFSIGGTGAVVTLRASVTVPAGMSVQRVEYYQGQILVGSATTSPFEITWNSLPLPPGTVTFTARVVTTDNHTSTSAPITITLTAPPAPELPLRPSPDTSESATHAPLDPWRER